MFFFVKKYRKTTGITQLNFGKLGNRASRDTFFRWTFFVCFYFGLEIPRATKNKYTVDPSPFPIILRDFSPNPTKPHVINERPLTRKYLTIFF